MDGAKQNKAEKDKHRMISLIRNLRNKTDEQSGGGREIKEQTLKYRNTFTRREGLGVGGNR